MIALTSTYIHTCFRPPNESSPTCPCPLPACCPAAASFMFNVVLSVCCVCCYCSRFELKMLLISWYQVLLLLFVLLYCSTNEKRDCVSLRNLPLPRTIYRADPPPPRRRRFIRTCPRPKGRIQDPRIRIQGIQPLSNRRSSLVNPGPNTSCSAWWCGRVPEDRRQWKISKSQSKAPHTGCSSNDFSVSAGGGGKVQSTSTSRSG